MAKYATKSADASGILDRALFCRPQGRGATLLRQGTPLPCTACGGTGQARPLPRLAVARHLRQMIRTCWELGKRPEFANLKLWKWAHMLGFRGHFSTKSRRYSTTLGALRDARRAWRTEQARAHTGLPDYDPATTLVVGHWAYQGSGYSPGGASTPSNSTATASVRNATRRARAGRTAATSSPDPMEPRSRQPASPGTSTPCSAVPGSAASGSMIFDTRRPPSSWNGASNSSSSGNSSATRTSASPPPSTPTSDSGSSATPSTSSAPPSATPPTALPSPMTVTLPRFAQHPSADVAVNYCRQTPQRPHRKQNPVGPLDSPRKSPGILLRRLRGLV